MNEWMQKAKKDAAKIGFRDDAIYEFSSSIAGSFKILKSLTRSQRSDFKPSEGL